MEPEAQALKHWFDEERFRKTAAQLSAIEPSFDAERFLQLSLPQLSPLSLMARLRLMTQCLHATLPGNYEKALGILWQLAPRIEHNFVSLVLPDFVATYGLAQVPLSLEALKYFTTFGSSEFGIRPFLRQDLAGTLKVMKHWSIDSHEAVRRLASEGTRPRLPWSFRLESLIVDPSPVLPILENLKADPSLYVRKSVANHLNDISRDHPEWVLHHLGRWDLNNTHTRWISKRALRTLIKAGNGEALALVGVGENTQVKVSSFTVSPTQVKLGERITLCCTIESTAEVEQLLVIDYAIQYVKKSGNPFPKVFKWKEVRLKAGDQLTLCKVQQIRDFTTRKHHPGTHQVELMVNGKVQGTAAFKLTC